MYGTRYVFFYDNYSPLPDLPLAWLLPWPCTAYSNMRQARHTRYTQYCRNANYSVWLRFLCPYLKKLLHYFWFGAWHYVCFKIHWYSIIDETRCPLEPRSDNTKRTSTTVLAKRSSSFHHHRRHHHGRRRHHYTYQPSPPPTPPPPDPKTFGRPRPRQAYISLSSNLVLTLLPLVI